MTYPRTDSIGIQARVASKDWFAKLWTRLSLAVVQSVPAELEECEMCRELSCSQERWNTCERRRVLGTE